MKTESINQRRFALYDNGGVTCDRYTAVFVNEPERQHGIFGALAFNAEPFHPQGFGQHTTAMKGRHLGRRIALADLPEQARRFVIQDCQP